MRVLLDTHAFLWAYSESGRLPAAVRNSIIEPENEVFVSAVSFWEIAIKVAIGKLQPVGQHPSKIIQVAESLGMKPIPLLPAEAATYGNLAEATHFDPFDRMLIWQAISRNMVLVSSDSKFRRFEKDGLRLLWK
ncbi:MAG: type II toxin-antitoxin system VapC family toxin [Pyrinomonadaceae bacterium]|nr:type II toxin-antitoxin system VapC family toxin [Blastocatellia bacterium]MDQ3490325.1 type II toxin-antitoxin system VapC family toxin [Acidobacteriota bacterium]